jgi:hypothetical protein
MSFSRLTLSRYVKPKITRPVSMLGVLMQPSPDMGGCIVLQMHYVRLQFVALQ